MKAFFVTELYLKSKPKEYRDKKWSKHWDRDLKD